MAKHKKLRKIAKSLKNQPKLKKILAEYLASVNKAGFDVEKALIYGHRGYMAMTEKDLTDLFDSHFEEIIENNNRILESEGTRSPWSFERELEDSQSELDKANKISDLLFEQAFLE